jgi:quercetin dioxygenase-like cupin family protein
VPLFGYVLAGTITVHFADGKKNVFHQGEAFAESVDTLHNGVNEGTEPVQLLVFVAGEKQVPFTIKATVDPEGHPRSQDEKTPVSPAAP